MLWLAVVVVLIAGALIWAAIYDRRERRLGHSFRGTGRMSREALRYREVFTPSPGSGADAKLPNSVPEARAGHQYEQDQEREQ